MRTVCASLVFCVFLFCMTAAFIAALHYQAAMAELETQTQIAKALRQYTLPSFEWRGDESGKQERRKEKL